MDITEDMARWIAWIDLPLEVGVALAKTPCSPEQVAAVQSQLTSGEAPPDETDPACAALAALCGLATMCETHRQRGVPESVSQATAKDLALWMREHYRQYGTWGLSATGWLSNHLSGRLFRLGRLQFLPTVCRFPNLGPDDPLQDGDPVIGVHIPAGEPLRPEACQASFDAAIAFFKRETWHGFTCESWLLGPDLYKLLPKESNILAFQRFFTPLSHPKDDRQTIERVFGSWPLNPQTAPRNTTLQRAVLAYYATGKRLDGGTGFRPR